MFAYTFWMKKYKINKSVSLNTRLLSYRRKHVWFQIKETKCFSLWLVRCVEDLKGHKVGSVVSHKFVQHLLPSFQWTTKYKRRKKDIALLRVKLIKPEFWNPFWTVLKIFHICYFILFCLNIEVYRVFNVIFDGFWIRNALRTRKSNKHVIQQLWSVYCIQIHEIKYGIF